jgi:hypothetical protein
MTIPGAWRGFGSAPFTYVYPRDAASSAKENFFLVAKYDREAKTLTLRRLTPPQHGADRAVPGGAVDFFQNPLLVRDAELAPLRL